MSNTLGLARGDLRHAASARVGIKKIRILSEIERARKWQLHLEWICLWSFDRHARVGFSPHPRHSVLVFDKRQLLQGPQDGEQDMGLVAIDPRAFVRYFRRSMNPAGLPFSDPRWTKRRDDKTSRSLQAPIEKRLNLKFRHSRASWNAMQCMTVSTAVQ